MKSPQELRDRLVKYWGLPGVRLRQLLDQDAWPWVLSIGKPSARTFNAQVASVQKHVEAWRQVRIGEVEWTNVGYRSGADTVRVPTRWRLHTPSEWVAATSDVQILAEYIALGNLVQAVPDDYRRLVIARPALWKDKPLEEVVQAVALSSQLSPGCAQGLPLRLLSGYGVDTKFFERNEELLSKLLDVRYDGEATRQGLCGFLDAYDDTRHWVLITPLERDLLPFRHQLITTSELTEASLPGSRLLVVENQRCLHLLRELPGTIAILGCGSDLAWLGSEQLQNKHIAYWGDIDTWGLRMLARARARQKDVTALLMTESVFDDHAESAVPEPVRAQDKPPEGLLPFEAALFLKLVRSKKGRLEQEFIAREVVWAALDSWIKG